MNFKRAKSSAQILPPLGSTKNKSSNKWKKLLELNQLKMSDNKSCENDQSPAYPQIKISKVKVKKVKKQQLDLSDIRKITKGIKDDLNECLNEQQPSFGYPLMQF